MRITGGTLYAAQPGRLLIARCTIRPEEDLLANLHSPGFFLGDVERNPDAARIDDDEQRLPGLDEFARDQVGGEQHARKRRADREQVGRFVAAERPQLLRDLRRS